MEFETCSQTVSSKDGEETGLHEACGVFGCVATGDWPTQLDVAHTICLGLVSLQHRGQESAGIVTSMGANDSLHRQKKGMGLVSHIFSEDDMVRLRGNIGLGHTRYSTHGESDTTNVQPFVVETLHGLTAVAHNGQLVNAKSLKRKLLRHGVGLSSGSDSELITQLLTHMPECGEPDGANWVGRIKRIMQETIASYALVIMNKDKLYAVRDPLGNRPLCVGKLLPAAAFSGKKIMDDSEVDGWVVASESCAFSSIGAQYYREVIPGEVVELSKKGVRSVYIAPKQKHTPPALCIFEYVYFARADSVFEGQMVYMVRQNCGRQLAKEAPVDVDMVSTVPESATPAAMAYATAINKPYGEVFTKNRYVGRSFIQPNMRLRQLAVAKKFGALTQNFKGKRIVLIDDSIVRGVTMIPIVKLLKAEGAKEVHIRIASPPIKYPCYMGINIPTHQELVANKVPVDQLADYFGADSLQYLSVEGLKAAVTEGIKSEAESVGHCVACLTGDYPVEPDW
ncbi:amidophosphoribosyltransferase-like [Pecten maximus]|uniref:amidophosphoribosyltransferase-like n=1 Tax=Pecten maximus TaxID=6579 RepID=UPI0014582CDA|nr:amidophosphoribosyltransferase-like [Pecten maximus]XP_033743012.1 amidophosphoribosyltransferase-like [Pecten maximus]